MSERRPSRTGPSTGRRMPTRSQPSPGGLKSMPLNPPPRKRAPKRNVTQDALDTAMAASAIASSEEPTSGAEQTIIPTTSRSQSPHLADSRSESPPVAESRSTSPPAATGHETRSESRDVSPPTQLTKRKRLTREPIIKAEAKSTTLAGSKRSRGDSDLCIEKSADPQEVDATGEDRPAKRARDGGSPLTDFNIHPNVTGEQSPVQSTQSIEPTTHEEAASYPNDDGSSLDDEVDSPPKRHQNHGMFSTPQASHRNSHRGGSSKKKAARTCPPKHSFAPLRPRPTFGLKSKVDRQSARREVLRRNNTFHERQEEVYDDGNESVSEPEDPMTLAEMKDLKRNGFKVNFGPHRNMVARINGATRPSMNNPISSSAANFSSTDFSTAHSFSPPSTILLPANLSMKGRVLTNPDLVAATHRFADWVEANPSRAVPSADEMEELLEYFHTQQQAKESSITTSTGSEHLVEPCSTSLDESVSDPVKNDEPIAPDDEMQEGIGEEKPPVPQDSSEVVSKAHEPQTPAPQRTPQAQTTGGWAWEGIKTMFATPLRNSLAFVGRQTPATAVTTNSHPITDTTVSSSLETPLSGVPATPTPAGPKPRPGTHNNRRARPSSGRSQNQNSVRRRREESKQLPIEQRGLLSQEEIAERHRLEDLEHEKTISEQREKQRASYVARFEDEEDEIALRAVDTPKQRDPNTPIRHRRPEEGDEFTWNGSERVVSGGRLKRKRNWVKPPGTYGLPRPEDVEEKSDDEKDPMINDLPHLMVDEFEDFSVEVSSSVRNQEQNTNAGGSRSSPRTSYDPDRTVLGDPHRARPYTGTRFQQPPDVQANIDEGRFPLASRQQVQVFNPFSPPANLNCPPTQPHNEPGSPPKSILRQPGSKMDKWADSVLESLSEPKIRKLDFANTPRINPLGQPKTPNASVVANAPQIDPTSVMLGKYRVERAPSVSDTTDKVSESLGRSDSPNAGVVAKAPQIDPTSIMLGKYRVERAPSVSDTTDTVSESSGQSNSNSVAAPEPTPALQQKQWTQAPPPKPRPGNAQLPQHQAAVEQARSVAEKFKPAKPSGLRNVTQMSPLQIEQENRGMAFTRFGEPNFSDEIMAAVMAVPDDMVFPSRKPRPVPSVEKVVRDKLDWFS